MKLAESLKRQDLAEAVNLLGEYYNAGRDLAGVYNQLLDLIRDALLVKTSDGNSSKVAALLSPAYSAAQLDALCSGLPASALLEWSEIIRRTLDYMRKTTNRRMEAELCAVRLCTIEGLPDKQSSSGSVETPEEKTKQDVSVAATESQTSISADKTPENPSRQPIRNQWEKALEMIKESLGADAYSILNTSTQGIPEEDALIVLCRDPATETILRTPKYLGAIREIVKELGGKKLAIRLTGDKQVFFEQNESVKAILEKAKAFRVSAKTEELL